MPMIWSVPPSSMSISSEEGHAVTPSDHAVTREKGESCRARVEGEGEGR